jgi:hypothetical protein
LLDDLRNCLKQLLADETLMFLPNNDDSNRNNNNDDEQANLPHRFEVKRSLMSSNSFPFVSGKYTYKYSKKMADITAYVMKAPAFVATLTKDRNVDATMKFDIQLVIVVIELATPLTCVGNISADIVHGIVPIPGAKHSR